MLILKTLLAFGLLERLAPREEAKCVPTPFESNGGFLLYLLAIAALCIALAYVCDEYLVPALEILCHNLKIAEDVAGVSLLAFGG
jgi:flagellar biosynthesis protein FliR